MSWVLDLNTVFCCLFVVCVYMFVWLCRATCSCVPGIYFNVWHITCYPKWEEALEFTCKVIGEVLVLGLLVVVCKIPYSSCIVNTGSSCSWFCHTYSWFLPRSWILDLSILLSICRVYKYMFGWLCQATCSLVSTSMFGISHAVQNEKKLWNLHII